MENGIETNTVVTCVDESSSKDDNGFVKYSYTFYVACRTQGGQTVEAKLGSGKAEDVRVHNAGWNKDLHEGNHMRIMYLPDRPDYVIHVAE